MLSLSSLLGGYSQDSRHFLVPQVIQSSMMDCGPAALKAMLDGFGIPVSYGRLREACQTDVDGTSIDTLEDLAVRLGLDALQVILPADHFFLPEAEALPALTVMLQPNGFTHFMVIWRRHGPWLQVMDPGTGRHWIRQEKVQERLYIHQHTLASIEWQEWAIGSEFCDPLLARMVSLCYDPAWSDGQLQEALAEESGQKLAVLDAATRMSASLVQAGGVDKGSKAGDLIEQLLDQPEHIPLGYWSALFSLENKEQVTLQGAVLLHVAGLAEEVEKSEEKVGVEGRKEKTAEGSEATDSASFQASFSQDSKKPEQQIFQTVCLDGIFTPLLIFSAVLLAGLGTVMEVIVLRGLVEIGQQTHLISQQNEAFMLVIFFLLSLLLLEWGLYSVSLRLGRRFELRLRQRFLEKIPRLEDRYFHSRLTSDMIQRAYELRHLRIIPVVAMQYLKILAEIVCITIGLILLYPQGNLLILFSSLSVLAISLVSQPLIQEQDMRFRTHIGGLSRFYLDALQGLLPIRSHGAVPALRSEHERLLVDWAKAGWDFFVTYERMTALNIVFSSGLAIMLLYSYMQSGSDSSGTLILLYWMLMLPQLGRSLAELTQLYPSLRNRLLRLLEPLNTPDESYDWYQEEEGGKGEEGKESEERKEGENGVSVHFENVRVVLAGKTVLDNLTTRLAPGEQVAVVGPSGAGKSTLVGLLLGWYRPAAGGTVRVDGKLLQGEWLHQLRRELVWVDPEVQLWNRSLQDNLNYGNDTETPPTVELLSQADLLDVLSRLPAGENTLLGENGGFLSGGEGQRVRLGRGLNREGPRLVILDEPFRGVTREQRQELLAQARSYWQGATLIFISHDLSDSLGFDRVWVIKNGRLVEDGQPQGLAACSPSAQSAYAQLLDQEKSVRTMIWNSANWVRLRLEKGKLYQGKEEVKVPSESNDSSGTGTT